METVEQEALEALVANGGTSYGIDLSRCTSSKERLVLMDAGYIVPVDGYLAYAITPKGRAALSPGAPPFQSGDV